ncbi:WUSCHEL-related homeobox 12-like [Panicum miliaceum]|uniref:WUSCHEL-related homeobox 12-like n=1 Tax=Panicum miliaceum TaxID=4540 RepID=A0A3L6RIY0_PANMI|nr:WUSCHEL-related homeobox 12-like [Panicum miliaceum]
MAYVPGAAAFGSSALELNLIVGVPVADEPASSLAHSTASASGVRLHVIPGKKRVEAIWYGEVASSIQNGRRACLEAKAGNEEETDRGVLSKACRSRGWPPPPTPGRGRSSTREPPARAPLSCGRWQQGGHYLDAAKLGGVLDARTKRPTVMHRTISPSMLLAMVRLIDIGSSKELGHGPMVSIRTVEQHTCYFDMSNNNTNAVSAVTKENEKAAMLGLLHYGFGATNME